MCHDPLQQQGFWKPPPNSDHRRDQRSGARHGSEQVAVGTGAECRELRKRSGETEWMDGP